MTKKIYTKLRQVPIPSVLSQLPQPTLKVTKPLPDSDVIYHTNFGTYPSHITVEKVLEFHPELKERYPDREFKLLKARTLGIKRYHGGIDTTTQEFLKNYVLVSYPKEKTKTK